MYLATDVDPTGLIFHAPLAHMDGHTKQRVNGIQPERPLR